LPQTLATGLYVAEALDGHALLQSSRRTVAQGKPVYIEVINDAGHDDIMHWHGLYLPAVQDGGERSVAVLLTALARQSLSLALQLADIDVDGARFDYRFDRASEVVAADQLLIRQATDGSP
jgi:hypothetical protein